MTPPAARQLSIADPSTLRCDGCGVYDPSLRHASHPTILSYLIGATDRARVGLRCSRCRAIQSMNAIAISLIAGWWSLRGPQLTIAAIRANLNGGVQQPVPNAQMLRGLARFEYDNENPDLAAMFARAAQRVQPQIENRRFLEELERSGHRILFPESPWRFAPFATLVVVTLAFLAIGTLLIPARKTGPPHVAQVAAPPRPAAPAVRPKATTAPEPANDNLSADELEKQLRPNSSPTLARAYLKKRLQDTRNEIAVRVRKGDDLWSIETSISALGSHPGLTRVLARPQLQTPYENLVAIVRESTRHYHGGAPVEVIEREAGVTLNETEVIPFSEIEDGSRYEALMRDRQAPEADRAAAAKALLRRDLQIRATVIVTTMLAIDECLRLLS